MNNAEILKGYICIESSTQTFTEYFLNLTQNPKKRHHGFKNLAHFTSNHFSCVPRPPVTLETFLKNCPLLIFGTSMYYIHM